MLDLSWATALLRRVLLRGTLGSARLTTLLLLSGSFLHRLLLDVLQELRHSHTSLLGIFGDSTLHLLNLFRSRLYASRTSSNSDLGTTATLRSALRGSLRLALGRPRVLGRPLGRVLGRW